MFTEIYRPKTLSEIVAQENAVVQLRRWAETWKEGQPSYKSAFLYGDPGTGKSSSVNAVANDFGWDILEIDTGDEVKTIQQFRELIETAIYTNPYKNLCLIIIEECESYKPSYFKAIEKLVEVSVNPIVFTANDEYSVKQLTPYFRENSLMIHFPVLKDYRIKIIAEKVLKAQNLQQPKLDRLIEVSHGDLRYVLNNLQAPEIIPRQSTDIVFGVVHDIFRGEWDGLTEGVKLDFIWYAVKANINNFYDDIYGQSVAEFVADIDLMFAHHYKLLSRDPRAAFRQDAYVIKILKSLPLHQKTAKIIVPKSEFTAAKVKLPAYQALAKHVHCSYKTARLEFNSYLLNIFKHMPKEKIEEVKQELPREKNLFDYATSQSTPD